MKPQVEFYVGQSTDVLRGLRRKSVHTAVTSPPYWGLRNYELVPVVWADGTECCLGLEPTPALFIEHLCQTFDALVPVLREDGTCWVNLGDSYAGGGKAGKNPEYQARHTEFGGAGRGTASYGVPMGIPKGFKAKDLVGIPWRFAFTMQARGWYLRAAIPWIKRNVMPSSVRDRPTTGVEYVFLFAHPDSGGRYFYDIEATKVASAAAAEGRKGSQNKKRKTRTEPDHGRVTNSGSDLGSSVPWETTPTRNRRDTDFFFDSLRHILEGGEALLHPEPEEDEELPPTGSISDEHPVPLALIVNPRPFKGAHFAVFAPQFVTPMILASTSEKGCCGTCGAPWIRDRPPGLDTWKPSCSCAPAEPVPAVVLDPFGGSGTTALTSLNLGRSSIYIDASDAYCDEIAMPRIRAGVEALDKKT